MRAEQTTGSNEAERHCNTEEYQRADIMGKQEAFGARKEAAYLQQLSRSCFKHHRKRHEE